ncbi:MAG: hypothetical protein WC488_05180 [Candidatus Micrarchaeia archaeon]
MSFVVGIKKVCALASGGLGVLILGDALMQFRSAQAVGVAATQEVMSGAAVLLMGVGAVFVLIAAFLWGSAKKDELVELQLQKEKESLTKKS